MLARILMQLGYYTDDSGGHHGYAGSEATWPHAVLFFLTAAIWRPFLLARDLEPIDIVFGVFQPCTSELAIQLDRLDLLALAC
jgi:hypothetical protein